MNEIKSAGRAAVAIAADISQPSEVAELFAEAEQALGPIQVVVNSAGIMPLSPIAKIDVETFDKVIATNLRGAFLVLGQAAQHVVEVVASSLCRAVCWQNPFPPTVRTLHRRRVLKDLFVCSAMNCVAATSL